MKKIAKITGIMLSVIMALSCLMLPAQAASESDLTITVDDDIAVVIKCKTTALGVVDIPSTYNGASVTRIGGSAFNACKNVTQINIPSTVKNIGSNAFEGCDMLEKVIFEGQTCDIGFAAFRNCMSLEEITLPSKLTAISDSMFYGCSSLDSIEIPSTVKSIGKEAFAVCRSLASVNIPASVSSIGKNAFIGCFSVSSYNVASGNAVYSSLDGVLYGPYEAGKTTAKSLLQYPYAKTQTSYTVASGTKIIADYAFGDNVSLTKVILPSGLEKIDNFAFYNCKNLFDVTIPSTVTELGSQSFGRCAALKNITIPANVETFESAFYMSGLETVVIENGVEIIGQKSFEKCTKLKSVTIPASVKIIDIGAFYGCTALENLRVPATVTTINRGAFQGCTKITLYVDKDSVAHNYAVSNSISFKITISVLDLPVKTSYNYKDTLDTTGLKLIVNYTDGSSEIVTSGYEVSPTKLSKTGSQTITVTYEGCTATFSVNVSYTLIQWIIMIFLLGFLWY